MTRPKKAVVDYFPHYVNHGRTMFTIENRFGNDGYAFWFKTLELLGATEQHFIDCNDPETWEFLLAKTRTDDSKANEILGLFCKLDAIDVDLWGMRIIWSQHFVSNLSTVYTRREIDVYGKEDIRSYCIQKYPLSGVSVNNNPQSKVKESKGKERRGEEIPAQSKPEKKPYGKFQNIMLTDEQHADLVSVYGDSTVNKELEKASAWQANNPAKKNHHAFMVNWIERNNSARPESTSTGYRRYTDAD